MKIRHLAILASIIPLMIACGGTSSGTGTDNGDQEGNDNASEIQQPGNGSGTTNNSGTPATSIPNGRNYTLTAWNDLGMHCMDGTDFSVFSILPPYNNLHAQLKNKNGGLVTSGVNITYEAHIGTDGKLNSSSANKTNFWQYAKKLFGVDLANDVGLKGKKTISKTPQPLTFNPTYQWWEAEAIPLTPYNDDQSKNYYPLVKVTAKDNSNNLLSSTLVVLPISDELDCKRCHASGTTAKPQKGWVNMSDKNKDFKYNILRLHDQRMPNAVSNNQQALQKQGYNYNNAGLEATAKAGTPILCVACHKSNALPGIGIDGIKAFTNAIHGFHDNVIDPKTQMRLGDSKNRSACYACHPGALTKCLRGAMGDAKNSSGQTIMQCQNCHGNLANVGDSTRDGWLDEPNCQACHHDSKRETSAVLTNGTLRAVLDNRFATNANTPMTGKSMYRFSKGHGNLQCEACHGATHAIYPAHKADNLLAEGTQGHSGTIAECSACHKSVPKTTTGGPHGMHPVGSSWVSAHQDVAEHGASQCTVCHGANYKGSPLSKMWTNRTLAGKNFTKGHQVSCYDCHNGPNGGDD